VDQPAFARGDGAEAGGRKCLRSDVRLLTAESIPQTGHDGACPSKIACITPSAGGARFVVPWGRASQNDTGISSREGAEQRRERRVARASSPQSS